MSKIIMSIAQNSNIISTGNVTVNIKMVGAGSLVEVWRKQQGMVGIGRLAYYKVGSRDSVYS